MQRNRLMLEETRDIVTVPASMIIRMLGKIGSQVPVKCWLNLDSFQLVFTRTTETITALIIKTKPAAHKISVQSTCSCIFLKLTIFCVL